MPNPETKRPPKRPAGVSGGRSPAGRGCRHEQARRGKSRAGWFSGYSGHGKPAAARTGRAQHFTLDIGKLATAFRFGRQPPIRHSTAPKSRWTEISAAYGQPRPETKHPPNRLAGISRELGARVSGLDADRLKPARLWIYTRHEKPAAVGAGRAQLVRLIFRKSTALPLNVKRSWGLRR